MTRTTLLDTFFANMPLLKKVISAHMPPSPSLPTQAQMGVMMCLSHKETMNVKEIAEQFGVTSSGATQLVDHLVKQGFLERSPAKTDRRMMEISLTPHGKQTLKLAHKRRVDMLKKVLDPLSDEEIAHLSRIQQKIIDHFNHV